MMDSCIYDGALYMLDERSDIKESSINPEDITYLIYEGEEWDWYIMDPETGKELASVVGRGKDVSQRAFSNQFLLEYVDECYRFDAKSRTEEYFSNQAIKDYFLVWAVEGGYLVNLVENNYITDEFAFISEENLQNGGEVELLEW